MPGNVKLHAFLKGVRPAGVSPDNANAIIGSSRVKRKLRQSAGDFPNNERMDESETMSVLVYHTGIGIFRMDTVHVTTFHALDT